MVSRPKLHPGAAVFLPQSSQDKIPVQEFTRLQGKYFISHWK